MFKSRERSGGRGGWEARGKLIETWACLGTRWERHNQYAYFLRKWDGRGSRMWMEGEALERKRSTCSLVSRGEILCADSVYAGLSVLNQEYEEIPSDSFMSVPHLCHGVGYT